MQCLEHTRDPQARQPQPPGAVAPTRPRRPWRRLVILPFTGGKTEARESSLSRKQRSWGWSPAGLAPPAPRPRAVLSQLPSRWARGRRPRCVGGLPWSPGGASTCIQPFHPSETRGNSPQILLLLLLGMSLRSCPSCTHSPSGTHLPRGRSPSPPGAHKSLHSRPRPLPDHASSPTHSSAAPGLLTVPRPLHTLCSLPGSSFHRSGCCWALDRFCPFPCSSPRNAPHPLRRGPRGHSLHAP